MAEAVSNAPFSIELFARWPDMDFNQHMRNAAFLGAAEDCRMRFLAERGFPTEAFRKLGLGPVVLEDRLVYKKELRLHEAFRVELELAASTRDGRRMKVRNTLYRVADGALAATVESHTLWLDLASRRPILPPDDLREAWFSAARSSDFEWLD